MNRKRTIALVSTITAIVLGAAGPVLASAAAPQTERGTLVLKLSDLRSAYLLRAGVVQYDRLNMTPDGVRQQLQRHFDVVMGVLLVSTPRSIETALARLEAADGHTWSTGERAGQRQQLLTMRYMQLRRLAEYRDRGEFPLNEGQATQAVPIFVDRHDTACAVGQLMRLSGWSKHVAEIQQTNNLVYVPDAMRSAVTAWALRSGLTWEEAALIQPAYGWPSAYNAGNYEPGELKLDNNGLRFENFQLQATNYTVPIPNAPPNFCFVFPGACTPASGPVPILNGVGLLAGQGQYGSGFSFPQHTPNGTNWIATNLNATAAEGRAQQVVIKFDVSAIAPDKRINQISESSYLYQSGFHDPFTFQAPDATYFLHTTARDGFTSIATLSIDQSTVPIGYYQKIDTEQFSPRIKISVEANLWLQDGVSIETFLLDFNLVTVPEPASGMGAIAGLLIMGVVAGRYRRER